MERIDANRFTWIGCNGTSDASTLGFAIQTYAWPKSFTLFNPKTGKEVSFQFHEPTKRRQTDSALLGKIYLSNCGKFAVTIYNT